MEEPRYRTPLPFDSGAPRAGLSSEALTLWSGMARRWG